MSGGGVEPLIVNVYIRIQGFEWWGVEPLIVNVCIRIQDFEWWRCLATEWVLPAVDGIH